jgi:UDP-N-acetylmuramate: L-alanyl-gamma-D-glutamyl-meso-diaminopimelate ligase
MKHLHFIGIGGTAMGATAVALHQASYKITGSDAKVYPPMSEVLANEGIQYAEGYAAENLDKNVDLYIVGNTIGRGNPELEALLNAKKPYCSLPEILKNEIIRGKRSFVVTGTHGKTTTTSLLTWIFENAKKNPSYMIGGVPENFTSGARITQSDLFVIEGDEYDTAFFDKRSKFLHYLPECVIVNNIEFDHADIFNSIDDILLTFKRLVAILPQNGLLLVNGDEEYCLHVAEKSFAKVVKIGTGERCDLRIKITLAGIDSTEFSLNEEKYVLPMVGEFNVRNAAMCIAAARHAGLTEQEIKEGVMSFGGVKRRQQVRGISARGVTVIDDFGHHPTAIRETLKGLRQKYPTQKLWALFEPRSNTSRRNILQGDFIKALLQADASVIAAVNMPEKVVVEERLDPALIAREVTAAGKPCFYAETTDDIIDRMQKNAQKGDVVVVFSNGGFDGIHNKLLAAL